jgi:hypothetical protein
MEIIGTVLVLAMVALYVIGIYRTTNRKGVS